MVAALANVACGESDPNSPSSPFQPGNGGANTGLVPGASGGALNPGAGGAVAGNGGITGNGGFGPGSGGTNVGGFGAGGPMGGNGGMVVGGAGGAVIGGAGGVVGSGGAPVDVGCGLNTKWAGDENCILPPPPDKGFQIHYGPSDYDDPVEVQKYLVPPGADTTVEGRVTSGNTTDVYFYKRQYRMRPGSHHLIVYDSGGTGGILGTGRRLGGTQNAVKDNPTGPMPPENEGIGMPLKANAQLRLDIHHYNGTEDPILREVWINFWYVDPATVKQEAKEMFLMASHGPIAPNAKVTVRGERNVPTNGRIVTTYGHRHSNNIRFSAWHVSGANRTLIYEDYDWKEPKVLEYNTLTSNPTPNPTSLTGGGFSGILNVKAGDKLSWECEIVNKSGGTITFNQNEAVTSEMCILIGDTVGVTFSPF